MATTGAVGSNPFIDFMNWMQTKERGGLDLNDSAQLLGVEMHRLYQTPGHYWTDAELRKIAESGQIVNDNGQTVNVSPEVKAAAQTILDHGGLSAIGNLDGETNADELLGIK